MPLNRCLIKNEFSLADPDLYKVADKDDPEALLEGVAMAGLVGVLRQLGDLAEFAAEIFHDLHEEVMATAARGHSLIVRVQQLEAEFPLVEKTLLSQTSHTSFLYNSGVDWHSNLRMDQNLVADGDLPRFVMDSYEECRGPPRLFLLDKFDVAGAGACLKRFTDPSFFKAESTSSTGRKSGQREKKTRRVKKRGPRWRNEDTPESFPSSHAKLHQLFLEERIETGGNDPERRVKLKKKQFTGSLFDQDNGKSYMEKILDTCPLKQNTVHDICIDPLPLTWISENDCESSLEIVEIGTVSPLKESIETDKSARSSPNSMEMVVKPSIDDFREDKWNEIIASEAMRATGLNHETDGSKILSNSPNALNSQELVNRGSKSEVTVDDGQNSDDGTSEIDNYMDALANIESEVETDSECNKNTCYLNLKPIVVDSDPSEGKRELQNFDAQSVGNSITSEDSSNFFRERGSASCSVSVDSFAETTPDHDAPVVAIPSVQAPNLDIDKMSVGHHSMSEVIPDKPEGRAARSSVAVEVDGASKSLQGETSNTSCLTYQNTMVLPVDTETSSKNCLPSPDLYEVYSSIAEPDFTSGIRDQGYVNQTASWSHVKTIADARETTDSGHLSHEDCPMHDMANTSDGLPDLLQIESKNADLDAPSVEEHINYLGLADVDDCSDIRPPLVYQPSSDCTYPETVLSVDLASDSKQGFNIQEHFSEVLNPDPTPPSDFVAGMLSSSLDPRTKEVSADVQSEEEAQPAPVIDQTEFFPPIFDQRHTLSSASKILDTVETDPSEMQDQWHKQPKQAYADPLEHHLAEADGLYPGSEINVEGSLVCGTGDECKASLNMAAFASDVVYQDFIPYSNELEPIETVEHLYDSENQEMQACATSDYCHNDKGDDKIKALSHGDSSSVYEAENILPDNIAADADGGKQVDLDNYHHENVILAISSSSLYTDKVQEQPLSVTGVSHINEVELPSCPAAEPVIFKHVNTDHNAPEHSPVHMCNIDENALFAEDFPDHGNSDVVDAPLTSDHNDHDVEPASSHQIDLLTGKEDNVESLSHNLLKPTIPYVERLDLLDGESKVDPLHADAMSSESINYAKQIQTPKHVDGERFFNATPQSAELIPEHSSQAMVKSTLVFLGNDTAIGNNQTLQEVESYGEPVYPKGFPVLGMVPAQPQMNLDAPPLPPLPPMQWRLSRFQNSSEAPQRQMEQQNIGPVQSVPATVSEIASQNIINEIKGEDHLSFTTPLSTRFQNGTQVSSDGYIAQQVVTQPMLQNASATPEGLVLQHTFGPVEQQNIGPVQSVPATVSEIASQNNINEIKREDHLSFTTPLSIRFQNGTQASADGYIAQQVVTQPMLQNASATPEGLVLQHTFGPVEPISATVVEVSSLNHQNRSKIEDYLSSLDDMNGIRREDSLFLATPTPTEAMIGNRNLEQPYQPSENLHEHGSLAEDLCDGHRPAMVDVKVDANTGGQDEQHEHISQATEQEEVKSHVQFLPPPKTQLLSGFVAPVAGLTWPNTYDGIAHNVDENANGTLQKKAPRPRNPLIDEVVAIDKSKLRKVERVKPALEPKQETRESLLEQMQLRKVERHKPPAETKAEEVASLLENLQLRKVGERVKAPIGWKAEERDFLLEQVQLRKVGEGVKPLVDSKTEESELLREQFQLRKVGERAKPKVEHKIEGTESLQVQLRKVGERVKSEAENKSEGTDSPHVQLRKVGKSEVEQKPEETESPRVQLRKVGDRVKSEVESKPEETESPRVQLRKIGERAHSQVGSKTEEKDSLFEQIRNKSFNLKPADVARPKIQGPNIQGPRTNLKVAAIIEKASNIRQAMAGSDEDDTDTWSDC